MGVIDRWSRNLLVTFVLMFPVGLVSFTLLLIVEGFRGAPSYEMENLVFGWWVCLFGSSIFFYLLHVGVSEFKTSRKYPDLYKYNVEARRPNKIINFVEQFEPCILARRASDDSLITLRLQDIVKAISVKVLKKKSLQLWLVDKDGNQYYWLEDDGFVIADLVTRLKQLGANIGSVEFIKIKTQGGKA